MTFESRKKIYADQLDALSKFPVWTLDQIKEYLHLDYDTVQKFVSVNWLYKFNVGRCTFYSCNNKKFTNQAIIKSIMMIDTNYIIDYSKYEKWIHYGSTLENKSLIAKGVHQVGYIDYSRRINLYHIYVYQVLTRKEYEKLAKMLIDIHNESDSDHIHVMFILRDDRIDELNTYLDEYPNLVAYKMGKYIEYQIGYVYRPHFNYLKL